MCKFDKFFFAEIFLEVQRFRLLFEPQQFDELFKSLFSPMKIDRLLVWQKIGQFTIRIPQSKFYFDIFLLIWLFDKRQFGVVSLSSSPFAFQLTNTFRHFSVLPTELSSFTKNNGLGFGCFDSFPVSEIEIVWKQR